MLHWSQPEFSLLSPRCHEAHVAHSMPGVQPPRGQLWTSPRARPPPQGQGAPLPAHPVGAELAPGQRVGGLGRGQMYTVTWRN